MGLVANSVKRHGNESKNTRCSKYDDNVQFLFWLSLGEQLRRQTDHPSLALHDSSTLAHQSNRLAQDVVKALLKDRNDALFSLFWARILQRKVTEIQTIGDPKVPRKRKSTSGTKLENRTPTIFLRLPKTITDESTLMRQIL